MNTLPFGMLIIYKILNLLKNLAEGWDVIDAKSTS